MLCGLFTGFPNTTNKLPKLNLNLKGTYYAFLYCVLYIVLQTINVATQGLFPKPFLLWRQYDIIVS